MSLGGPESFKKCDYQIVPKTLALFTAKLPKAPIWRLFYWAFHLIASFVALSRFFMQVFGFAPLFGFQLFSSHSWPYVLRPHRAWNFWKNELSAPQIFAIGSFLFRWDSQRIGFLGDSCQSLRALISYFSCFSGQSIYKVQGYSNPSSLFLQGPLLFWIFLVLSILNHHLLSSLLEVHDPFSLHMSSLSFAQQPLCFGSFFLFLLVSTFLPHP